MRNIHPLKRLRFELGARQLDIAARAAIQPARLSLIENGRVTPRPEELARIAAALGVAPELLDTPSTQTGRVG